jgi:hypothetical protein
MPEFSQHPPPPVPTPATPVSRPTRTGDTVCVACKLPSGIILRIFVWETYAEPRRDGTVNREARRAIPVPGVEPFVIKGVWAASAGQGYNANNGAVADLLPGGYAITDGVPKDIWDKWLDQNKASRLVVNHIIFAHKDRPSLIQEVRKHSAILCGMEPLDRANPGARMGGIDRRLRIGVLDGVDGLQR